MHVMYMYVTTDHWQVEHTVKTVGFKVLTTFLSLQMWESLIPVDRM